MSGIANEVGTGMRLRVEMYRHREFANSVRELKKEHMGGRCRANFADQN